MKTAPTLLFTVLTLSFVAGQNLPTYHIADNNIVIRYGEQRFEAAAQSVLSIANNAMQQLTKKYHLALTARVEIQLTATTAEFCQRTGRPWWQGSVYRNRVIYLQPISILRERGVLETTIRHEIMHRLVDEHTKGSGPAWLSEALAIYNSGEIAVLKPEQKMVKEDNMTWQGLDRRLQTTTRKEDLDRLYFQLYSLGQFLEGEFLADHLAKLIDELGHSIQFDRACRDALGASAKALEQRWLRYWRKMM